MAEPTPLRVFAVIMVMLTPVWAMVPFFLHALWKHHSSDEVAKRQAEEVHTRVEARRLRYAAANRSNGRRRKLSRS